jgi:polysaccharide biosynthesis/export protein
MGERFFQGLLFSFFFMLTILPSRADYKLCPGDQLELTVAGVPEMRTVMRLDVDGLISVPLVGDVKAAGMTVSEIRALVRKGLEGKFLRQINQTGLEYQVTFEPEKISLNIIEYRPLYVMGDVGRAGEVPFRPGMLVQQSIALAGGYDIARLRNTDPVMQAADLRSEYQTLWIQLAREKARIERLRTELALPAGDGDLARQSPVASSDLTEIRANEAKALELRRTERQREFDYIDKSLAQAGESLDTVNAQRAKEEEGVKTDASELDRLGDMEKRGSTTSARVVEARRSLLLSSTRLLQTIAQASQIRLQETELERRKTRFDETRQQEALRDLQEAQVHVASLNAQLQAAGDKLLHATALRSELTHGGMRPPLITVTRRGESGIIRMEAREDTELQSGDTVDVRLSSSPEPGADPER